MMRWLFFCIFAIWGSVALFSCSSQKTLLCIPGATQAFHEYSMVWGNGEYGIAYLLAERVYFARISASGVLLEQPVLVADTRSSHPWLVWTGKEYALVWDHFGATDKVPQVYMRRIVCK